MLQMKCSECEGTLRSPFLVEIGKVGCTHCGATVAVKNVLVTTRSFSMYRDALLNRIRHYRGLLKEVERERQQLENDRTASGAAKKTLDQYYEALKELLEAARGNYRLAVPPDLPLEMETSGQRTRARLVNLSTRGAAITPEGLAAPLRQGSECQLKLSLPESPAQLAITARVAWAGKNEPGQGSGSMTMGVSFVNLTETARGSIWDYIVETYERAHAPEGAVSLRTV